MSDYKYRLLIADGKEWNGVVRFKEEGETSFIPNPGAKGYNRDWNDYQDWIKEGNKPLPPAE